MSFFSQLTVDTDIFYIEINVEGLLHDPSIELTCYCIAKTCVCYSRELIVQVGITHPEHGRFVNTEWIFTQESVKTFVPITQFETPQRLSYSTKPSLTYYNLPADIKSTLDSTFRQTLIENLGDQYTLDFVLENCKNVVPLPQ